jgi:hypothetical protein
MVDIVVITIVASICGADKCDYVEIFGEAKEPWFRAFLELPHGILLGETNRRVFNWLDLDEFSKRFFASIAAIKPITAGDTCAIDGKTLCGSYDSVRGISPIHMLNACAS